MANEAYITKQLKGTPTLAGDILSLSVLLGPDNLSYAIFKNGFEEVVEIVDVQLVNNSQVHQGYTEKVTFLLNNFQLPTQKFSKLNIAVINRDFSLLPSAYAQADIKQLLQFTTGSEPIKNHRCVEQGNVSICYSPNTELNAYLEKTFPNAIITHAAVVTVNLLFEQHSLKDSNLLMVIGHSEFEIAARNEQGLLFYNLFNYDNNEDILYYLLFIMEQFGLNPLDVKLAVAAQREVNDELFKTIKKYIRQVKFCVHDPSVKVSGEVAQLPAHYYFTLLNQHLCAL